MREGVRRKCVHAAIGFCVAAVLTLSSADFGRVTAPADPQGTGLTRAGFALAPVWHAVLAAKPGSFTVKKE